MDGNDIESPQELELRRLDKAVKVLEKKLSTCNEMRKNSDEIRDSQAILFEKIHKELDESRQTISQQNREIKSIMTNIEQAIVVVTEDLKVGGNWSAYVRNIFGREPGPEERVDQFLFQSCNLSQDSISQAVSAIISTVGEPDFMFSCNAHQMPSEYVILAPAGDKIVEIDWNPIVTDDFVVEKIIVALRDVTELRRLRQVAEEKQAFVKLISEIIEHDFAEVHVFLTAAVKMIERNVALIKGNSRDLRVVEELFRMAHTVKGNARSFHFEAIVDAVHHLEGVYETLRADPASWNAARMIHDAEGVLAILAAYQDVLRDKLKFIEDGSVIGHTFEDAVAGILARATDRPPATTLQELSKVYEAHFFLPLNELLKTSIAAVDHLARAIAKPKPRVRCVGNVMLFKGLAPTLADIFNHCLRNSVDHGLEPENVRRAKGKDPQGTITLSVEARGKDLELAVSDDGGGLDLPALKAKGEALGILKKSGARDEEIAEVIFASGVSTKAEVSEISGRGVGMDAVRATLTEMGGTIAVEFLGPKSSDGKRPFRLVMRLPNAANGRHGGRAA